MNIPRRRLLATCSLGLVGWTLCPSMALGSAQHRAFAQPTPKRTLQWPQDHGPHPDFRTEWWYFTGWFESPTLPEPFGVQITFFRSAPDTPQQTNSRFAPTQLLFAHAALAIPKEGQLIHADIIRRAGSGGAQLQANPEEVLSIALPGWALTTKDGQLWHCSIEHNNLSMRLSMNTTQRLWMQGDEGYSRKGPLPEQSSHYATLPHMQAQGQVRIKGQNHQVKGTFWMDHEWSSTVLAPEAQGWDWVGLHGNKGESLMAFRIRHKDSVRPPIWTHAALRSADGQVSTLAPIQFENQGFWTSPRTGVQYPVRQTLKVGTRQWALEPLMNDQELDARSSTGTLYWEGAVRVMDEHSQPWGRGYLEMTGYDRPMKL